MDKISLKKAACSLSFLGAYKFSKRNGESWIVISNKI